MNALPPATNVRVILYVERIKNSCGALHLDCAEGSPRRARWNFDATLTARKVDSDFPTEMAQLVL
jgi:hypothetical protein